MKVIGFLFCLFLIHYSALAEVLPCGSSLNFKDGEIDCSRINGREAEVGSWHLVRSDSGKKWWKDARNSVVWGPTHAYEIEGGATVAFDGVTAEKTCNEVGGELPTLEDYYAAYHWQQAELVMNNWDDSVISPNPVFWAASKYLNDKYWWISFDRDGKFSKFHQPIPMNGVGYPGDFRCIWRMENLGLKFFQVSSGQ